MLLEYSDSHTVDCSGYTAIPISSRVNSIFIVSTRQGIKQQNEPTTKKKWEEKQIEAEKIPNQITFIKQHSEYHQLRIFTHFQPNFVRGNLIFVLVSLI